MSDEQHKTFRTLLWVMEISDDFNTIFLAFLWIMGWHSVFWILFTAWMIGLILGVGRIGLLKKLLGKFEKELKPGIQVEEA